MQVVHKFSCCHFVLHCMQFCLSESFMLFNLPSDVRRQQGRQGPRHCGRHVSATAAAPAYSQSAPESGPRQSWTLAICPVPLPLLSFLLPVFFSLSLSLCVCGFVVAGIRALAGGRLVIVIIMAGINVDAL